ncbi:MAG: hypothetical protein J5606_09705 [Bacteroidales bacterium]|nr:hypothetical protein [Bacteroidales bacterium]
MKDKVIIGILLLLLSVACDKYNSTIEGYVFYEDEGNLYKAKDAIVYKQVVQKEDTINIVATSCDSNGCFLFDNTTKGTWRLKGKIVLDSVIYEGCSSVFTTKGTDKVVVPDIVLQPISTND